MRKGNEDIIRLLKSGSASASNKMRDFILISNLLKKILTLAKPDYSLSASNWVESNYYTSTANVLLSVTKLIHFH